MPADIAADATGSHKDDTFTHDDLLFRFAGVRFPSGS